MRHSRKRRRELYDDRRPHGFERSLETRNLTFSERQGRRRSAFRELLGFLAIGVVFLLAGLAVMVGWRLGALLLPKIEGLVVFLVGGFIDLAGLLRYRTKMRNAGLRRS